MRHMRSALWACAVIWLCIAFSRTAWAAVPQPQELSAGAAILMDADTGQVLYEKNSRQKMYPASITKIMTGLLALENLSTNSSIAVSATAVDTPYWGSLAYLQAGEVLTVDSVMYAMMLRSGNDAANVLAESVAGTQREFAERMNEKAAELGAVQTHFTNAHGLPDQDHYTTAYDMALITREALQTEGLPQYLGAPEYTMAATNLFGERLFTNKHRMLLKNSEQYDEHVIGGKTGYTDQSGYTLATVARRDNRTLICMIFDSDTHYADTAALLNLGFHEFSLYTHSLEESGLVQMPVQASGQTAGVAIYTVPQSVTFLLHNSLDPQDITAQLSGLAEGPVEAELPHGSLALHFNGTPSAGLPQKLTEIPIYVEIVWQAPAQQANNSAPPGEVAGNHKFGGTAVVAAFVLPIIVLLLFAWYRWNWLSRRMRRKESRSRKAYFDAPFSH